VIYLLIAVIWFIISVASHKDNTARWCALTIANIWLSLSVLIMSVEL